MGNLLYNLLGLDTVHAGHVVATARLFAVDAAGTAVKIRLNDVVGRLVPTHETAKGMRGAPDAHHGGCRQRG